MEKLLKRAINLVKYIFKNYGNMIGFVSTVLSNLATVVSAIIVLFTLNEMQIQRNNAYMPDIAFEHVTVNISWGDTTQLDSYSDYLPDTDNTAEINPTIVNLPVRNIGVGVAKKVSFIVEAENYIAWINAFNELNPTSEYTYTYNNGIMTIFNGTIQNVFNATYHNEKTFLLPNAEEAYQITIPVQYVKLFEHFCKTCKSFTVPNVEVKVSFEDVQGIEYRKVISLAFEQILLLDDGNGNGFAAYQIVMK